MLELALLAGLLLWSRDEAPERAQGPILGLLMTTLVLNRISAILFGALLVVVLMASQPRRPVVVYMALAAGLFTGWFYYAVVSPESMAKLGHVMPRIAVVSAGGLMAGAGVLVANRLPERWRRGWLPGLFVAGVLGWLAMELSSTHPWEEWTRNGSALAAYLDPRIAVVSGLGLLLLLIRVPGTRAPIVLAVLSLLVVLHHKHVAELYPWALKRFLPFACPLVAAGLTGWILLVPGRVAAWGRPVVAAILLLLAGWMQRERLTEVVREREYLGLNDTLVQVAEAVPDGALVVADHFKWATPLAALHGLTVLNGEALWKKKDPELTHTVIDTLRRNHSNPLVWMTGTDDGLAVYPGLETVDAELLLAMDPVSFRVTIHHPRNRGFSSRTSSLEPRVYEFSSDSVAR
jgi:hypothetical protein